MERYHPSEVYELFVRHMNTPRVVVDSGVCATATLVQVHSARKHGVLLEAVAALSEHGVCVRKGYISSDDGRWFMDVFHVTDAAGQKVADADALLARLESSLSAEALPRAAGPASEGLTLLELVGADRPGLLSEVFAVLHDLRCNTVEARAWTHGGRVAALVFVCDEETGAPIDDAARVRRIESRLRHVLRGGARGARTVLADPSAAGNLDRRLHQLLNEDGEADSRAAAPTTAGGGGGGGAVVTVSCRDRPKLLFDVVCTLTDLDYVVYHGTFDTDGDHAQQEFYIRRSDGRPISSEAERQHVIRCLQAAIERRASEVRDRVQAVVSPLLVLHGTPPIAAVLCCAHLAAPGRQVPFVHARLSTSPPMCSAEFPRGARPSDAIFLCSGREARAAHLRPPRAARLRDARVPGERPLGDARRDHDQGRHGHERLPRHRRGRPPRRPQDDRRGDTEDRHGEPPGGRGAVASPLLGGRRRRRPRRRRWAVLPWEHCQEEPLQPWPHKILLVRTGDVSDDMACSCKYGRCMG
uniref:ACT domain-containing protein ACR n=1 Tax=Oryza brachyantha TaxID=4533 RepID=J3LLZ8_ORYBR